MKSFWTIKNNEPNPKLPEMLNESNKENDALHLIFQHNTWIYLMIPYNVFGGMLLVFVSRHAWKDEVIVIDVGLNGSITLLRNLIFSKSSFKISIKYLINNSYFKFENKVYRQIIDIPIGSDTTPFIANMFLYYHENKRILKTNE